MYIENEPLMCSIVKLRCVICNNPHVTNQAFINANKGKIWAQTCVNCDLHYEINSETPDHEIFAMRMIHG